jgi:RNA polymerase sigma factor (sigma-70 family)
MKARQMINYNGMSVNNLKDYLKIRKIMAEPEIELAQEFDGGIETQTVSPDDELTAVINNTLKGLTPRECKVLKHRFGLDDHEELTLKEVGYILKVGPERIRQIEAKALRKLRPRAPVPYFRFVGNDMHVEYEYSPSEILKDWT